MVRADGGIRGRVTDAHATYDVGDIPAAVVSRVAEHALSDHVELCKSDMVTFADLSSEGTGRP